MRLNFEKPLPTDVFFFSRFAATYAVLGVFRRDITLRRKRALEDFQASKLDQQMKRDVYSLRSSNMADCQNDNAGNQLAVLLTQANVLMQSPVHQLFSGRIIVVHRKQYSFYYYRLPSGPYPG